MSASTSSHLPYQTSDGAQVSDENALNLPRSSFSVLYQVSKKKALDLVSMLRHAIVSCSFSGITDTVRLLRDPIRDEHANLHHEPVTQGGGRISFLE